MFTAHMNNEKIAEELLAKTRSPQEGYGYAIRQEKGIERSRTMNPFGAQTLTTKQEPVHYVNTRGRQNQKNNQNNQRGRGRFPRPTVSTWITKHKGSATTTKNKLNTKLYVFI